MQGKSVNNFYKLKLYLTFRLLKGITIVNSLTTKKFHLLLTHIVSSKSDDLFTAEELKKLRDSLKLTEEDLTLLIHTINYLVKQSTKIILKPTILKKHLMEYLKLDEEKSEVFTKFWSEETNKDIGNFEEIMKLDDLAWEHDITVADQISNVQEVPNARLKLSLSSSNGDKNDGVILELNKDELVQLYNTLEAIQMKLDTFNM